MPNDVEKEIKELRDKIDSIEQSLAFQKTNELALNTADIKNIFSLLEVVSTAPTHVPRKLFEQIKLYSSGGIYRVYFYLVGVGWKYVALS
jgi:hypothetical protein